MKASILLLPIVYVITHFIYTCLKQDTISILLSNSLNEIEYRRDNGRKYNSLNPLPTFENKTYIWENNESIH